MLEVADIFRLHGESFRATHALGSGQRRAMADIEHCRTAYFGGHLERCDHCAHEHYSYHSCRNRHCPKCHGDQTQGWLEKQQTRLLPGSYYLLTFTLPSSLRRLARAHPRQIYGLLMTRAVASLQKLVRDPQWLGAPVPVLAVLHTWTRALLFHPHVHLLVPAGGLSTDGTWLTARHSAFLVPAYALSRIFRAKFKAALKRLGWCEPNDPCWKQPWHVHCRHAGSGHKVLDYLARYVFRVALVNSRLESLHQGQVTFRYRDNRTQQIRHLTLSAPEFINRFLQHVLPKGFVKVRTYGLWSATQQQRLAQLQTQLAPPAPALQPSPQHQPTPSRPPSIPEPTRCPKCKLGHMIFLLEILPQRTRAP